MSGEVETIRPAEIRPEVRQTIGSALLVDAGRIARRLRVSPEELGDLAGRLLDLSDVVPADARSLR